MSENLDSAKKAQLDAAAMDYIESLNFVVQIGGNTFQADPVSYNSLVSVLSVGSLPPGFYWVDASNQRVTVDFAFLSSLASAIAAERFVRFNAYQDRKERIRNATSIPELFV